MGSALRRSCQCQHSGVPGKREEGKRKKKKGKKKKGVQNNTGLNSKRIAQVTKHVALPSGGTWRGALEERSEALGEGGGFRTAAPALCGAQRLPLPRPTSTPRPRPCGHRQGGAGRGSGRSAAARRGFPNLLLPLPAEPRRKPRKAAPGAAAALPGSPLARPLRLPAGGPPRPPTCPHL